MAGAMFATSASHTDRLRIEAEHMGQGNDRNYTKSGLSELTYGLKPILMVLIREVVRYIRRSLSATAV